MDNEQMKELFESEPDKWIVYWKVCSHHDWLKNESPEWNSTQFYKLILKEHEHIADAVIANPDVRVEFDFEDDDWQIFTEFFEYYQPHHKYRLAKPQCDGKFNGGYIKASQEAHELLLLLNYEEDFDLASETKDKFFFVNGDTVRLDGLPIFTMFKQFYINNGALSWDEPIQINSIEDLNELSIVGEEEMQIEFDMNMKNNEKTKEIISITDDNGKEYKFVKPEFECELLKVLHFKLNNPDILAIVNSDVVVTFFDNGECYYMDETNASDYNLTPIKPKWYDNIKFPLPYVNNKHGEFDFIESKENLLQHHLVMFHLGKYRLLTKEEVNSFYFDGKE